MIHVWVDLSIILNVFTKNQTKSLVKQKLVIKNDKIELITDDIDMAESFNKKFVSISITLAASIENVPLTTDSIEVIEKQLYLSGWLHSNFKDY